MKYLILKLKGPMQAWGTHSYEGVRPSQSFPTYSGIIGLLAACLGYRRGDIEKMQALSHGLKMAVRIDDNQKFKICKMTDFHTIKDARESYSGLKSHETIITRKEYLYDAEFTVVIWKTIDSSCSLSEIENAVKKPIYTPYLGRRSCPISRPLFEAIIEAKDEFEAISNINPKTGLMYSETRTSVGIPHKIRDIPIWEQKRQFSSRMIYSHGGNNVPQ